MRLFGPLYSWTVRWAGHRRAPWALGGLSVAESSVFPIPPDVLLAPMSLARPNRAAAFALIATVGSVLGGLIGYALGHFALYLVEPWIAAADYEQAYRTAVDWFQDWGFWVVLVAGFSPIPYKVFTVAAGATGVALVPFVVASLLGRGARFFLVAGLVAWGGARLEPWLLRHVERIGWISVVLLLLGMLWVKHG
ncbi:YqaA family protein [Halorhodospira sp. 9622]|uniref:YqaA family protein n=1 Tax=Halorhodospira sp. 9622 TaxID=2899136 RepID=UPI001EE8CA14|nr:DedA family protein [Halorhodospira sp. 9622]